MLIRNTLVRNPHVRPIRENVIVPSNIPILEPAPQPQNRIRNIQRIPRHPRVVISNIPPIRRLNRVASWALRGQLRTRQNDTSDLGARKRDRHRPGPRIYHMRRSQRIITPEIELGAGRIFPAHDRQLLDLLRDELVPRERRVRVAARVQQPGEILEEADGRDGHACVCAFCQRLAVQRYGLPGLFWREPWERATGIVIRDLGRVFAELVRPRVEEAHVAEGAAQADGYIVVAVVV